MAIRITKIHVTIDASLKMSAETLWSKEMKSVIHQERTVIVNVNEKMSIATFSNLPIAIAFDVNLEAFILTVIVLKDFANILEKFLDVQNVTANMRTYAEHFLIAQNARMMEMGSLLIVQLWLKIVQRQAVVMGIHVLVRTIAITPRKIAVVVKVPVIFT